MCIMSEYFFIRIFPMKYFLLIGFLLLSLFSYTQTLSLSTNSDSALYYYRLGWEMVLNEGNYEASEAAYRKMADHDAGFLIGMSLLGRITEDSTEQRNIFNKIEKGKSQIVGDERKLLDVFIELHKLRLIRKEKPEQAQAQLTFAIELARKNLGYIARKYEDEPYYQAEFIESINYLEGPEIALDSLAKLKQAPLMPFLRGYKAQMLAKTGEIGQAFELSDELLIHYPFGKVPKPFMVKAELYAQEGNMKLARAFVAKALEIDPKNIDAKRLIKKIKD